MSPGFYVAIVLLILISTAFFFAGGERKKKLEQDILDVLRISSMRSRSVSEIIDRVGTKRGKESWDHQNTQLNLQYDTSFKPNKGRTLAALRSLEKKGLIMKIPAPGVRRKNYLYSIVRI